MSISESAGQTLNVSSTDITFTLHVCNAGGAAGAAFTVTDDWSSAAPEDSWVFNGPYFLGNPVPSISSIGVSGGTNSVTFNINPMPGGFNGCVDIPCYLTMLTGTPGKCAWHNDAYISYGAMLLSPQPLLFQMFASRRHLP